MEPPPIQPGTSKPKFEWYEHLWMGLPFALVAVGGAIGGACGGAAWAINRSLFQKIEKPVLRYICTGLVSVSAVFAYLVLASILMSVIKKNR